MNEYRAILLLGPTASGKTPLGEILARRGLRGNRCVHFDFGVHLRRIVERDQPDAVASRPDIEFLRSVLLSGALLEDGHFPIAQRILRQFLSGGHVDRKTFVVLSGLPRHAGQARAVDAMVDVAAVVALRCSGETVRLRVERDTGGDRAERTDDDAAAIESKLDIYDRRTMPLLRHYRDRSVCIASIEVTADMTPETAFHRVEAALGRDAAALFNEKENRR